MHVPDFPIPADLKTTLQALPRSYFVGGCVRDHFLGLVPKDYDIEVFGMDYDGLQARLSPLGRMDLVGKSFGVIKFTPHGGSECYDIALARTEKLLPGGGHQAFAVQTGKDITMEEACGRRDFTINAMAVDPRTHELIDPYKGHSDLTTGILRHTSPRFAEDPLRVLRLFQFAGRFDFTAAEETLTLCREIKDQYPTLAVERVWEEWNKWATKSVNPKRGLDTLRATGWLSHFPELDALIGCPQDPRWHPEGDAFTHTGFVCNAMVRLPEWAELSPEEKAIAMFGALCHDLGKPSCTFEEYKEREGRMCIVSPGHEAAGVLPTKVFLERIGFPKKLINKVTKLTQMHMAHLQLKDSDTAVRQLSLAMQPNSIAGLSRVIRADHGGRPPLEEHNPPGHAMMVTRATALNILHEPPKPLLMGKNFLAWGIKPGKAVGVLHEAAYTAQIEGKYSDLATGEAWFRYNRARILEEAKLAPPRLLSGKELKEAGLHQDAMFGKIHRELFEAQLDGKFTNIPEAITWLKFQVATSGYVIPETVLDKLSGPFREPEVDVASP